MIDHRKLRSVLAGMDLPQWVLAKRLGVPPSTLSDWLRGARPAPDDLTASVERTLKLPPGTLHDNA